MNEEAARGWKITTRTICLGPEMAAAPVGAAFAKKIELSGDQDSTLYFLNQVVSSPHACLACASR